MMFFPIVILSMPLGDERDFMEQLYTQHYRLMFSTAWKYCKKKELVEDIISDSCMSLMDKIGILKELDENKLRIYIVSTVRNACLNALKKEKRRSKRFIHLDDTQIDSICSDENIGAKVELDILLEQVIHIIESLSEKEQLIIRMKFSLGLDNAAIAKEVGLSETSISKYVSRIREKVKKQIGMKGGMQNEEE